MDALRMNFLHDKLLIKTRLSMFGSYIHAEHIRCCPTVTKICICKPALGGITSKIAIWPSAELNRGTAGAVWTHFVLCIIEAAVGPDGSHIWSRGPGQLLPLWRRTGKITPRGADFYHAKSGVQQFGRLLNCKLIATLACGKKPHNGVSDLKRMSKVYGSHRW